MARLSLVVQLCALLLWGCGGEAAGGTDGPVVPPSMVLVPGGVVGLDGEEIKVSDFLLDAQEVSNDQFEAFIAATEHVTDAERRGGSVVFRAGEPVPGGDPYVFVEGASWRAPEGPGSDLLERGDHPVRHVSWNDAVAYARWGGQRLPSREEWVLAAGGGESAGHTFPWGSEHRPARAHLFNGWQGPFPVEDAGGDGYVGTSPVGSFPATGAGLFDLVGNVWEWTSRVRSFGTSDEDRMAAALGGSYLSGEEVDTRNSARPGPEVGQTLWLGRADAASDVGFRCAQDLGPR